MIGLLFLLSLPVLAGHVSPVLYGPDGDEVDEATDNHNPDCESLGLSNELKIDQAQIDASSTETFSNEHGAITFTSDANRTGFSFSNANPFVDAVVIKASNAANVYFYDPPVGADSGLVTPTNPGGLAGISHITVCFAEPAPQLTVTKSDSDADDAVVPGDDVTYTITASNTGTAGATAVVISDNLDDDLTVLSATFSNNGGAATACTVGVANAISCAVGTLAAGTSAVATIVVDVQADACGTIQNTSSVDSEETDPASSNTVTLTVNCAPALTVAKTDSDADNSVVPGDDVTYTITASNTGTAGASGVVISDNLDDDLTVLSANFSNNGGPATACTVGAGNAITCNVGALANGTSAVATIVVDVEGDACGTVQNTSTVDSDQTNAATSNTVTLTVVCASTLAGGGGPSTTPASPAAGTAASTAVPNTAAAATSQLASGLLSLLLVGALSCLVVLRLAHRRASGR